MDINLFGNISPFSLISDSMFSAPLLPLDEFGWGMSICKIVGGSPKVYHFQVETYLKFNIGDLLLLFAIISFFWLFLWKTSNHDIAIISLGFHFLSCSK